MTKIRFNQNGNWAIVLMLCGMLGACQEQKPSDFATPDLGQYLNWSGQAFDILAEDLDGDGRADLTVTDHGGNQAQIFYQSHPRQWAMGPVFSGVGFHPGTLIRWPGEPPRFVLSAEGDNAVRALVPDATAGYTVQSEIPEVRPRYSQRFSWPGWGEGLALSPFDMDSLFLLKGYSPVDGKFAERVHVPLSENPPSVLLPGPLTVTDIDGDGSDDILYATPVTRQVFAVQAPKPKLPERKKKKSENTPPGIKPRLLATDPQWGGPTEVVAGDLNGNGQVDLLVPDEAAPGRINVLMNEGAGTFKIAQSIVGPNGEGITEIKSTIDQDGLRYVLTAGYGALALYQVPKAWTPEQTLVPLTLRWSAGDHATALAFKDIDGDGWLDVVMGRSSGKQTLWVHFGPLWNSFKTVSHKAFALD